MLSGFGLLSSFKLLSIKAASDLQCDNEIPINNVR
jgi:hypothetical protein